VNELPLTLERCRELHQQLVDGVPTAPDDFATTFLDPLIAWLTTRNPAIDPQFVNDAAERAIVAVIKNPGSYDPARRDLEPYLHMSAQADLRTLLAREKKHRQGRRSLEAVELFQKAGNYTGREDDPSLGLLIEEEVLELEAEVPESVRQGLTQQEAQVLDLMLRGEFRTAAFAEVLGILDRPPKEQRRLVKQVKDRLKARIKRGRET
jgi:hypothetical protein